MVLLKAIHVRLSLMLNKSTTMTLFDLIAVAHSAGFIAKLYN